MVPGLLTIAIPTFNRADFLGLCLKRIAEEIALLNPSIQNQVVVYVSNNASTDHTDNVIQQYQQFGQMNLTVVRQLVNIGANANVLHCYRAAVTPYVWVMGDDDVILAGGLGLVLELLRDRCVDLLFLNGYAYDTHYLNAPAWGAGRSGIVRHTNAEDLIRRAHVSLTFITAVIVRAGVCIDQYESVWKETSFPQLSWVFDLLKEGGTFMTLQNRVYAARMNNSGGYGAVEVFGRQLQTITKNIFGSTSRAAKAMEHGLIVSWFPIYVKEMRRGNARYLQEDVHLELHRLFAGNWRYYIFLWPLLWLPRGLAGMYFQLLRVLRKFFSYALI